MLSKAISKNSLLLAAFALCAAGLLAGTYQLTKARIAQSEREAAQKALLEVVPPRLHDNDMLADIFATPEASLHQLGLSQPADIHIARKQGEFVAAIIPAVAPDGYSGDIRLIIGINADGSIAGVRVLDHNETPGLGDKVDLRKSEWILSFNEKSLINPAVTGWKVSKDGGEFDQFTGATITPRAVVKKVYDSLEFFEQHKEALIDSTPVTNNLQHQPIKSSTADE